MALFQRRHAVAVWVLAFMFAAWLAACGGGTAPAPSFGRLAYVTNWGSNDVSAYTINSASGALTPVKCVGAACSLINNFVAGAGPNSISADPKGRFAYVANMASNDISAYTIDATTGALTQVVCAAGCSAITPANFAAGTGTNSIAVDPFGKFVYATNQVSGSISAYTINVSSGALTAVAGSPFAAGAVPASVAIGPTGLFVYVANSNSGNISVYAINATTGALTAIAGSPYAAGSLPYAVTIDPGGKFAYVANYGSNDISAYTINATTGALTRISCGPAGTAGCTGAAVPTNFAAGTKPYSVAVDPLGKYAYVTNSVSGNVSAYVINGTTGALAAVAGSPFAAGTNPRSVIVDASGNFAYVADFGSNAIYVYGIASATGALTAIAGSPFAAGANPSSIITVQ